ncbi:glucose PTS transporter transcription antiterminator GlcT [Clostridium hydrogeniformans]|uniref:glucose PTS transporter transcription antiterminator GlcT n=1 Tax=Clostridium hydrogeniformans TaxID=349933 RepID=UPI0004881CB6|nr:PRD domain-containing protein [Clostridium hydrogeniformans]
MWYVKKVFNNNVVLIEEDNKEKVIFGKGIGFGKKIGEMIGRENVDKIFSIEDNQNGKNFRNLISYADSNVVGMCEEAIYMIERELNESLDEKIHISLTDHIALTLKRLKEDKEIHNPFLVETETLYKREFDIAKKVARFIEKTMKVEIPDGEIGFITLHIHSARNEGKLSNTIKYTFLGNSIVEYIEDTLDIYIDRQSLDYARFLTHVRFAIERVMANNMVKNELLDVIKNTYKESFKIAKGVAKIIEEDVDMRILEDEIAYLALHVERLKNSSNK